MTKSKGAARLLTENQQDILHRALCAIATSSKGVAWVLDCEDSQTLLAMGALVEVEKSKYGKLIRVKEPKND